MFFAMSRIHQPNPNQNNDGCNHRKHPEPLACPDGMSRKSIALYYYSQSVAAGEGDHNTLFQARPGEQLQLEANVSEPKSGLTGKLKRAVRLLTPPIILGAVRAVRGRRSTED